MRPEAAELAQQLDRLARSFSSLRDEVGAGARRTGGVSSPRLAREVINSLLRVIDGVQKCSSSAGADRVSLELAEEVLAEAAAAEAYGAAVVGRPSMETSALARWAELLERVLEVLDRVPVASALLDVPEVDVAHAAEDYISDAKRDARSSFFWSAALIVVLLAACVVAGVGLLRVSSGGQFGVLVAHIAVAATFLLAAVPFWSQAERYRRAAADGRRMARQLNQLSAFLWPFPERPRTIMRAALAQRLFARPVGDDDPLLEPLWPSAQDLYPSASRPAEDVGEEEAG